MLNINQLYKTIDQKEKQRKDIYGELLKKCHSRIISSSEKCDTVTFFIVPSFLVGVPLYKQNDAISYIMQKLIANGFFVMYTHPNLLFISWDKSHIRVPQSQNNMNSNGYYIETNQPKQIEYNVQNQQAKKNNYKSVTEYKPSGNFINSPEMLEDLRNKMGNFFSK
tara:strand:- start:880 stop:1377 length:498 start_codon:yes stop_codon:yes gene_type:complete